MRDPASYSFAHGGKDGHPFPVDRATHDSTIESLRTAVREAAAGRTERVGALKRLARLAAEGETEPILYGQPARQRRTIEGAQEP